VTLEGGAAVLGSECLVGFTRKAEQRILVSPLKETGAHDPAIAVDMHRAVSRRIFTHLRRDNVSDAAWNGSAYGFSEAVQPIIRPAAWSR
jgi:hypothetical protein